MPHFLGVDFGSSCIYVALARAEQIVSQCKLDLPNDFDIANAKDQLIVAKKIRNQLKKFKISTKRCALILSAHEVFIRTFLVKSNSDLESLIKIIKEKLSAVLPYPIEEAMWDFISIGNDEFFVVAVEKTLVESKLKILQLAKLRVRAIRDEPYGIAAYFKKLTNAVIFNCHQGYGSMVAIDNKRILPGFTAQVCVEDISAFIKRGLALLVNPTDEVYLIGNMARFAQEQIPDNKIFDDEFILAKAAAIKDLNQINLLPWRKKREVRLKKNFWLLLFGAGVITSAIITWRYFVVNKKIQHYQEAQNNWQLKVDNLSSKYSKLRAALTQYKKLKAQDEVLQSVHKQQSRLVNYFKKMPQILGENLYLISWIRQNNKMSIAGNAINYRQIMEFEKRLQITKVLKNPIIKDVVNTNGFKRFDIESN